MVARASIKDEVVAISRDYLGPAAERFIDRQITTHLQKDPSAINRKDLIKLIDWIKLAFALLTDDDALVNEYIRRLRKVARGNS